MKLECIIAMDEFSGGIDEQTFIEAIGGKNLNTEKMPAKRIYGYTVVDSLKTILSLGSEDYLKIYGWSIERALVFTNVHFGRSPMVAIRAHPLTPAMVVYQQPEKTDPLAIKLAKLEGIPLVVTKLSVEDLLKQMNLLKEGK
jgi:putative transcriptional regulator